MAGPLLFLFLSSRRKIAAARISLSTCAGGIQVAVMDL